MNARWVKLGGAMLFAGALALAGCSGSKGSDGASGAVGPQGPSGEDGTDLTAVAKPESCEVCHRDAGAEHQAIYDRMTDASVLAATIDSVVSTANPNTSPVTYTTVVTFSLKKNGVPYGDATLSGLGQKRYMAAKYDPATRTFETASATSFGSLATTATPGTYTVKAAAAKFAPESSDAFVYFYFAENPTLVAPKGHYNLYDNVASVAKAFGALASTDPAVNYVSTANVSGCEKCHPAPYMKHGYRAGAVAGVNDMVACKACHHDQRVGTDFDWQVLADDPAKLAALSASGTKTVDWTRGDGLATAAKYQYAATVMNDTHMSHAMEFPYPQSMANCVTCHAGKLDRILTDANFTLTTCKSCHPVTGTNGDPKRAPPLKSLVTANAGLAAVHTMDLYTFAGACNGCHNGTNLAVAKSFAQIHRGYDPAVRATATQKFSDAYKVTIDDASIAGSVLTVKFTATEAAAVAGYGVAQIAPTVMVGLYGYDTKDFVVSAHSRVNGVRNLEWVVGETHPRFSLVSKNAGATSVEWTITVNLGDWAGLIEDGIVRRAEIAVMPALKKDAASAAVALDAVTKTFDLAGNRLDAAYFSPIVDGAKCNVCHDALGTTFHSGDRGGSIVNCRICHTTREGASHLEMQSRSIDSYVHAIHSFQAFDAKSVDFSDPVALMRYNHHVESTYPNFTILNCESCHVEGAFEVPDQARSLPGILSAAAVNAGWNREIGAVPAYVTGPGSRACGSCHRAEAINEDDAGRLASINAHTASFGTQLEAASGTTVVDKAIETIMALFK